MGSSRQLIRELEAAGFIIVGQRGSHVKLKRGNTTVIVPHPNKDLKKGLETAIRKQAGL